MASFLSDVKTDQRPQVSLPAGNYGKGTAPGLKILMYSDKGSKPDKNGAMQHSFLVASTDDNVEGTAFLKVVLHPLWLTPESTALAFTEASRNKEGEVQADYVTKAVEGGEATMESIENAIAYWQKVAREKVEAANTPAEQVEAAVAAQYKKELTSIAIKVGTYLRLLDWHGVARDVQYDPKQLVGTEFSGKVEVREYNGKSGAEITTVFSKKG